MRCVAHLSEKEKVKINKRKNQKENFRDFSFSMLALLNDLLDQANCERESFPRYKHR
jgi:hypothetical protein